MVKGKQDQPLPRTFATDATLSPDFREILGGWEIGSAVCSARSGLGPPLNSACRTPAELRSETQLLKSIKVLSMECSMDGYGGYGSMQTLKFWPSGLSLRFAIKRAA